MRPLQADDPPRIGAYVLVGRLGRGAMGTMYLGRSPGGRPVAVKVARSDLAEDPQFRERFRREVEMARSIGGFWTAAVVDADPDSIRPWLATEYVSGPSLQHAVATHGAFPESAVRRLTAGLAEALAAIHRAGLVHRDLKPSNVLLGTDGPRVIDFGVSRLMDGAKLTATGSFFGTPGYLSPEQITGVEVGPRSDVFALGAVIAFAATGRSPFGDGDTPTLMYRAVHTEPDLTDVPDPLRPLLASCLAHDPESRPAPPQILDAVGLEAEPVTTTEWLPAPVRNLVDQYDQPLQPTPTRVDIAAVGPPTEETPPPAPPAPATDPPSHPTGGPGNPTTGHPGNNQVSAEQAPGRPVHGGQVRGASAWFWTSRWAAVGWGCGTLLAALLAGTAVLAPNQNVPQSEIATGFGRVLALIGFVVAVSVLIRLTRAASRPQYTLEIGGPGLTVAKSGRTNGGRPHWQLPWHTIARIRVVADRSRPWVVVWFAENARNPLTDGRFRQRNGGFEVFPIGHERLFRRRRVDVREVRAALGWYAGPAYDPGDQRR